MSLYSGVRCRSPRLLRLFSVVLLLPVLGANINCARLPPGQNGLSGRRIRVYMRFSHPLEPNFYYYFLINKYGQHGTNNAHGPVPVLGPLPGQNGSFGNGFATSSSPDTTGSIPGLPDYGITDFVLFNSSEPDGLDLHHFSGDPNTQQHAPLALQSRLLNPILPTISDIDPMASRTLQFDIDMEQLVTNATTDAAKIAEAQSIQYLQVNIVATNRTPIDPNSPVLKEVDALGDGRNSNELSVFLQIDLSQAHTYSSQDIGGLISPEPAGDLYPPGSPDLALDLVDWSITVQPHS